MTQSTTGEQKPTEKTQPDMELSEAVRTVKTAIAAEQNRLKQIAEGTEYEPILLIGETAQGYDAHVMADPSKVAQVMLDYDYPLYKVLEEDWPQEMWDALAQMVGLESVYSVDM